MNRFPTLPEAIYLLTIDNDEDKVRIALTLSTLRHLLQTVSEYRFSSFLSIVTREPQSFNYVAGAIKEGKNSLPPDEFVFLAEQAALTGAWEEFKSMYFSDALSDLDDRSSLLTEIVALSVFTSYNSLGKNAVSKLISLSIEVPSRFLELLYSDEDSNHLNQVDLASTVIVNSYLESDLLNLLNEYYALTVEV